MKRRRMALKKSRFLLDFMSEVVDGSEIRLKKSRSIACQ
jgi:hypothetical protein